MNIPKTNLEKIMKKIILIFLCVTGFTQAANGVFAINRVCAVSSSGCFTGDSTGYPVTITQPGSYILTSNLSTGSLATNRITIQADNVTLDLNGFSIIGPRSCTGEAGTLSCTQPGMTADAIVVFNSTHNVTVKNGSIKGFDKGIVMNGGSANRMQVMEVHSSENDIGFLVGNGVISNSQANRNIRYGFSSTNTGNDNGFLRIENSEAYGNGAHSAHAQICSDVFFVNNGTNSSADADCAYYTNGSYCKVTPCINN